MSRPIEFIEDSDSKNDESVQILNGSSNVEVIALSESVGECKGTAREGQADAMPSSPQRRYCDLNEIEIIEPNKSIELSAPFYQDISTSRLDISYQTTNCIINTPLGDKNNTAENPKKFLDLLVNDEWSVDVESSGKKQNEHHFDLKNIADKWGVQSSKKPEPLSVNHAYKDENLVENNIGVADSQKSQVGAADILLDFPLSPVKHRSSTDEKQDSITGHNSSPGPNLEALTNDIHDGVMKVGNKRMLENSKDELRDLPKKKKRTIALSRTLAKSTKSPDAVELNLSNFLDNSDSYTTDVLLTPTKKPNIIRTGSQPILGNTDRSQEARRSKTLAIEDLQRAKSSAREISQLESYITYGQYYSREESRSKIRQLLRENKNAFKQVNQIYRDNTKARSQMIIEFSPSLFQLFQKIEGNLQQQVTPAIIQPSYDDYVPLIRFLRKCNSIYDFNNDFYYPCDPKIIEENVSLLYYDAQEFFEQYTSEKKELYRKIRFFSKNKKHVILVLSDLNKLKRAIFQLENERYKARVEQRLSGTEEALRPRSKKSSQVGELGIKNFDLEQRLRFIDREWNLKIHTVNSHMEFLHSLPNLVSLIGKQRMDPAIRYMKYAHLNVKSAQNSTEALKKTFHQIARMPELKANNAVSLYPSFQSLFEDMQRGKLQSDNEGKYLMTEAIERRLYKLFTTTDPNDAIE
ncbi:mms4p [Saccharomyces arboricola H-6]|uniref:Mms4p n=1 Tax=Saccharomyces arboricola (strain H-6 / AS 2.3317 / CBS 10644) TaxID=1160507 RepID=J8Q515_SACAR|nr:mms4p [Saccharomyces arboricola H-6]